VSLDRVPITELYATAMLDFQRGIGRYDAIVVPAFFYGDLIAGDFIAPVDAMQATGNYPSWTYDAMPPALRTLYQWNGVGYGVLNDADGQILYYRRDILNDSQHQATFREANGHDMTVPPATWQQVLEIARFFNGKNWDDHDPYPDSGMVMHLKPGEQGHYHFTSLAASFAIAGGPEVDRHHNVFWFDPTDMAPLINGPGHVAALEMLLKLNRTGPIEQIGWRLPQGWDYFLRGKAVFMYSWGDLGSLCQDTQRSLVKGECAAVVLPHSDKYWDAASNGWMAADSSRTVGNTTGGSWHGVISKLAGEKEVAYAFLSLMALPEVSLWNAQHGWTGVDPGFTYQFLPPDGTAKRANYITAGWSEADVEDYLRAYHKTFNAPTMLNYLRIRGTPDYWSVLDTQLAAALGGRNTARQALDDTAEAWQQITDRLGRNQQLKAYQAAIGYKP
jgi:multiple sugar transport system substrate-binding protein